MVNVSIDIDDHDSGSPPPCTQYYIVEYRPTGTTGWNRLEPYPLAPPVVINALPDGIDYDLRIARVCCDGSQSDWDTSTFVTTP